MIKGRFDTSCDLRVPRVAASGELTLNAVLRHSSSEMWGMWAPRSPPQCASCGETGHSAEFCTHFPQERSEHADAWTHLDQAPELEADDGHDVLLMDASVVRQPGDGHCLFHSLGAALAREEAQPSGEALRQELVQWLRAHKEEVHNGSTFSEWIDRDSSLTVDEYCSMMERGNRWGGGIELAAFARSQKVDVHVFERRGSKFFRIAYYRSPTPTGRAVHLLYVGRSHYDLLEGGHLETLPEDASTVSSGSDEQSDSSWSLPYEASQAYLLDQFIKEMREEPKASNEPAQSDKDAPTENEQAGDHHDFMEQFMLSAMGASKKKRITEGHQRQRQRPGIAGPEAGCAQ